MVLCHSVKTACLGKIWFSRYRHLTSRPIRKLDSSNCYIFWTVWPFFIIFCIKIEKYDTFKMVQWLFWKKSYFGPKWAQNLLANEIAGIFDHLYHLKYLMSHFDFLHADRHPWKEEVECVTLGWSCPDMPDFARFCPRWFWPLGAVQWAWKWLKMKD